jgi:hypothetical protein
MFRQNTVHCECRISIGQANGFDPIYDSPPGDQIRTFDFNHDALKSGTEGGSLWIPKHGSGPKSSSLKRWSVIPRSGLVSRLALH